MDVDETPERIDLTAAIASGLAAGQPEDAGEYPIPPRIGSSQGLAIELAGRPATYKDSPNRTIGADL